MQLVSNYMHLLRSCSSLRNPFKRSHRYLNNLTSCLACWSHVDNIMRYLYDLRRRKVDLCDFISLIKMVKILTFRPEYFENYNHSNLLTEMKALSWNLKKNVMHNNHSYSNANSSFKGINCFFFYEQMYNFHASFFFVSWNAIFLLHACHFVTCNKVASI